MLIQTNTFNVLSSCCPLKKTCKAGNGCLGFFCADTILAHAKAWDLVLWKCPRHSMTLPSASTFYTFTERLTRLKLLEMCLYLDSDIWAGCFTIIFVGSFHYFKPVPCWTLFCENVAGVPRPFDQLPSRMVKVHTFKTPEMRLYFVSGIWGGCLTIIFVWSFPYFKFLTKINSKMRRK